MTEEVATLARAKLRKTPYEILRPSRGPQVELVFLVVADLFGVQRPKQTSELELGK